MSEVYKKLLEKWLPTMTINLFLPIRFGEEFGLSNKEVAYRVMAVLNVRNQGQNVNGATVYENDGIFRKLCNNKASSHLSLMKQKYTASYKEELSLNPYYISGFMCNPLSRKHYFAKDKHDLDEYLIGTKSILNSRGRAASNRALEIASSIGIEYDKKLLGYFEFGE